MCLKIVLNLLINWLLFWVIIYDQFMNYWLNGLLTMVTMLMPNWELCSTEYLEILVKNLSNTFKMIIRFVVIYCEFECKMSTNKNDLKVRQPMIGSSVERHWIEVKSIVENRNQILTNNWCKKWRISSVAAFLHSSDHLL